MDILWLKRVDSLCRLVPRSALESGRAAGEDRLCVLRPGGLGDLVLLTRACMAEGLDLLKIQWIVEKRNSPWLGYLGIPHACYDTWETFVTCIGGKKTFPAVLNTEQTFGLAALFCKRVTAAAGTLIGFASNRRADLHDVSVRYDLRQRELETFRNLLREARLHVEGLPQGAFALPSMTRPSEDPYVVVALGGLQMPYKRLSASDWVKLLRVARAEGRTVYLLGAPRDRAFSEQLCRRLPDQITNLVGTLAFTEVVAHVRGAQRMVGVDSGLIHIADFFGVPCDVIIREDLVPKWGPVTEGSRIFTGIEQVPE